MQPVRFAAYRAKVTTCWIGIACLGCLAGTALGQGEPVDRAREAMRREVAAKAAADQARLDRLKAMPAPLAAAQVVAPRALIFDMEELEPDGEGDERAPRQWVTVFSKQAFDDYLFGRTDGEEFCRTELGKLLSQKVERAVREQQLTSAEQAKLRLAGKGDIKRLFDQTNEKRKEFETVRRDLRKAEAFLNGLQPLRLSWKHGPWKGESLFSKVLDKMLDDRATDKRRT